MRSSCQTRALNPDASGQGAGQCNIPVARPAGNVLFPALLHESGFKAEFGYDSRRGFARVSATLWIGE
ncbi:hypothetical protein [Desulfosporosinus sp. SB140]|uniref:hypothetical protein n=1 Tax=Desulfosporosinus paludis TaxID=3115649 RepID=UPI003890D55E